MHRNLRLNKSVSDMEQWFLVESDDVKRLEEIEAVLGSRALGAAIIKAKDVMVDKPSAYNVNFERWTHKDFGRGVVSGSRNTAGIVDGIVRAIGDLATEKGAFNGLPAGMLANDARVLKGIKGVLLAKCGTIIKLIPLAIAREMESELRGTAGEIDSILNSVKDSDMTSDSSFMHKIGKKGTGSISGSSIGPSGYPEWAAAGAVAPIAAVAAAKIAGGALSILAPVAGAIGAAIAPVVAVPIVGATVGALINFIIRMRSRSVRVDSVDLSDLTEDKLGVYTLPIATAVLSNFKNKLRLPGELQVKFAYAEANDALADKISKALSEGVRRASVASLSAIMGELNKCFNGYFTKRTLEYTLSKMRHPKGTSPEKIKYLPLTAAEKHAAAKAAGLSDEDTDRFLGLPEAPAASARTAKVASKPEEEVHDEVASATEEPVAAYLGGSTTLAHDSVLQKVKDIITGDIEELASADDITKAIMKAPPESLDAITVDYIGRLAKDMVTRL